MDKIIVVGGYAYAGPEGMNAVNYGDLYTACLYMDGTVTVPHPGSFADAKAAGKLLPAHLIERMQSALIAWSSANGKTVEIEYYDDGNIVGDEE